MEQIKRVVDRAEFKYPPQDGWHHVWVFDHSSCHAAMADDALDANKMNVNPGVKQRQMRDTMWHGKVQKMNFQLGVPKGMNAGSAGEGDKYYWYGCRPDEWPKCTILRMRRPLLNTIL